MHQMPMTVAGEKALRDELKRLKTVERPRIVQAISEARSHGDLKENAEYHAAREEQGFCEARIQEIESKLSRARIINIKILPNTGKVIFGVTVTLINEATKEEVTYAIVGEDEADVPAGKISITSPIARALIGKQEGDTVVVKAPNGEMPYTIATVEH